MLRFRSLGSGSTGNAALVEATSAGRTSRLLIDCGFGLKQLDLRLAQAGLAASDIDAVFVTHEHGDHIGCAHSLSRRNRIPVWMSEGTWLATGGRDFEGLLNLARDDAEFEVGDICVQPFTVPHDAREPLQLRCTDGNRTLGVLTDLGHATAHVLARLSGVHALLLELTTTAICWPIRPIRPFSSIVSAATTATCRTRPPQRSHARCCTTACATWWLHT